MAPATNEAALDEGGFTDPFGGSVTRGQLLGILAFHQAYHAGQLGLSRAPRGEAGGDRRAATQHPGLRPAAAAAHHEP